MELHQLTTEELRGYDAGKMRETEKDIRRALVDIRMAVYAPRGANTAKVRGLRKALARLHTLRHQAAGSKQSVKTKHA